MFESSIAPFYLLYIIIFYYFKRRTINSGKSKVNEDQARIHEGYIKVELDEGDGQLKEIRIPYCYYGIFDGHAGPGAAVAAAARLHSIIEVL